MSRKKAPPCKVRNVLPYAYHEAGHAVVGHVIGRLIERVSLAMSPENCYRGYCGFSPSMESANGQFIYHIQLEYHSLASPSLPRSLASP